LKTIAIIGDIMIDETWYSDCNRLSPEAPVPVASLRQKTKVLGGAANVAANLRALVPEMQIYLGGWLGHDYQHLLSEKNIHLWPGGWLPENLTNIKLRIIDNHKGYHLVRVDNEEYIDCKGRFLPCDEIISWINEIRPDSIILSDYLKGTITYDLAKTIINLHRDRVKIFVDTRRQDISMFKNAHWITPNKHEFAKILDFVHIRQPLWKQIPEMIYGQNNLQGILLTRGSEGMDLYTSKEKDGKFQRIQLHEDPTNINVVDVTGAGDTALAAFAAIRTLGCKDYDYTLKLVNELAGDVCTHRGTTVPAKTLKEHGFNGYTEKKEE
jgi:rfaE bifunctional protein kinase chain/domain